MKNGAIMPSSWYGCLVYVNGTVMQDNKKVGLGVERSVGLTFAQETTLREWLLEIISPSGQVRVGIRFDIPEKESASSIEDLISRHTG